MWLERFGTVDQNVFFGFCAAVFVIVLLLAVCWIIRLRYHNPTPGQSLTFSLNLAIPMICVAVLFRGVQPKWTSEGSLQSVCQVFVAFNVLGYTLFAGALLVKSWMVLLSFRWEKNVVEWLGHFVLWILVVSLGAVVVVWEVTFMPNVHPTSATDEEQNNRSELVSFYECRGWLEDGSRDREQFGWRVGVSACHGAILLLAVTALPFYFCISSVPRWAKPTVVSGVLAIANALVCVIAGLIVWYRYDARTLRRTDSIKYAIIGSLQLWMLLFTVIVSLIAEVLTFRAIKTPGNSRGGSAVQRHDSRTAHDDDTQRESSQEMKPRKKWKRSAKKLENSDIDLNKRKSKGFYTNRRSDSSRPMSTVDRTNTNQSLAERRSIDADYCEAVEKDYENEGEEEEEDEEENDDESVKSSGYSSSYVMQY